LPLIANSNQLPAISHLPQSLCPREYRRRKDFLFREGGEPTLALTKERKTELVAAYRVLLEKSQALVLADYRGLPMADLSALRGKVREANGEFHVTKNTLTELAMKEVGLPAASDMFEGPTAVGFAFDDPPALAKAIVDFAKDSQFMKIKGGYLGNRVLSVAEVEALAALPPLPIVQAQLLGVIAAPAARLAGVIASGVRQVVNVIKAYADKNAEDGQAAAETAVVEAAAPAEAAEPAAAEAAAPAEAMPAEAAPAEVEATATEPAAAEAVSAEAAAAEAAAPAEAAEPAAAEAAPAEPAEPAASAE
jgi:large subunit ribosomal protein L10